MLRVSFALSKHPILAKLAGKCHHGLGRFGTGSPGTSGRQRPPAGDAPFSRRRRYCMWTHFAIRGDDDMRRAVICMMLACSLTLPRMLQAQGPIPPSMFVTSSGCCLTQYNGLTGAQIRVPDTGSLGVYAMTVGPNGNLFITNSAGIQEFSGQTGAVIGTFIAPGSGGMDVPRALAFGPDGNLYVLSDGPASVLEFNGATGAFIGTFVGPEAGPGSLGTVYGNGMTFGPNGDLFISNTFPIGGGG